jgi:hypothetical protein
LPILFLVLSIPRIIIAEIAIKGIDLFPRGKCREGPKKCDEWIRFLPRGPQNGPAFLKDELHTITCFEAEPVANLNGNGDLPFAA